MGPMSLKQWLQSRLLPAVLRVDSWKDRYGIKPQPKFERKTFRTGESGHEILEALAENLAQKQTRLGG